MHIYTGGHFVYSILHNTIKYANAFYLLNCLIQSTEMRCKSWRWCIIRSLYYLVTDRYFQLHMHVWNKLNIFNFISYVNYCSFINWNLGKIHRYLFSSPLFYVNSKCAICRWCVLCIDLCFSHVIASKSAFMHKTVSRCNCMWDPQRLASRKV